MTEPTLVQFLEDVMLEVRERTTRILSELMEQLGPRPFGHDEADTLSQLALYLDVCDDPAWWGQWLERQAALTGRAHAEAAAIREAVRLEALLEKHGGPEAVRAAIILRDLGKAERALAAAEQVEALPKFTVRPPLLLPADDDLLALTHTPPPPPAPAMPMPGAPMGALPGGG